MICSACRQQLAAAHAGRRAAVAGLTKTMASTASATTAARRGLATAAVRPAMTSSATTRPTLSQTVRPLQPLRPAVARFSAAAEAASDPSPASTPPSPSKPDFLDEAESHIWDLLAAALSPAELSVRDISGGCGSMYGIEISSDKFRGLNMLKQQRMVNAVLGDLVKGWHGVQLRTRVP